MATDPTPPMTAPCTAPPPVVLAAFGVPAAALTTLPGGQGSSWLATPAATAGSGQAATPLVLKPVADEVEAAEVTWLADALAGLPRPLAGFRLPTDVPSASGRWVVDGWRASTHLSGRVGPAGRWAPLLATAAAFTAAVAHLPRPAVLDQRTHPWAAADRAAWDEPPLQVEAWHVHPDMVALVGALRALARRRGCEGSLQRPFQLVHGDLTGNVLFADELAPAVIDVSPYWRPAAYAGAVIVADGLLWWQQGTDLLTAAGHSGQVALVARAVLFRLLTDAELLRTPDGTGRLPAAAMARYQHAADVLVSSTA